MTEMLEGIFRRLTI